VRVKWVKEGSDGDYNEKDGAGAAGNLANAGKHVRIE
jgi:hypothetical protein